MLSFEWEMMIHKTLKWLMSYDWMMGILLLSDWLTEKAIRKSKSKNMKDFENKGKLLIL